MGLDDRQADWCTAVLAAQMLGGIPSRQIPRLAARGLITVRRVPGCPPRYLRSDVERLAVESTVAATRTAAGDPRAATA
jgi:hypothetical protein